MTERELLLGFLASVCEARRCPRHADVILHNAVDVVLYQLELKVKDYGKDYGGDFWTALWRTLAEAGVETVHGWPVKTLTGGPGGQS